MKRAARLAALCALGVGLRLTLAPAPALRRRGGPPPAALAGLPLIEVEPSGPPGDWLAVLVTGDGGWARLDRALAAELTARGVAVVALDSPRYLWKRRTPAEAAQALARILLRCGVGRGRERLILIGYSHGADLLPFMASRLPTPLRARLALVALVAPGPRADFEFHLRDLLLDAPHADALDVAAELEKLRGLRLLCIYGAREPRSLCPRLPPGLTERLRRPGGHHLDRDYATLARRILASAGHESGAAP